MKGVSYLTDQNNQKKAVVINLNILEKHMTEVINFLEGFISELHKNDEEKLLSKEGSKRKSISKFKA